MNHTRLHGVFAPNSQHGAQVTPASRGKGNWGKVSDEPQTPAGRRASMSWAKRLKREFSIDIETCGQCGGQVKVIASIEAPNMIQKILDQLKDKAETTAHTPLLPKSRVPPTGMFG